MQASAYLVVDAGTGEVLAASNAHTELRIASLTKLMTVLIALESIEAHFGKQLRATRSTPPLSPPSPAR